MPHYSFKKTRLNIVIKMFLKLSVSYGLCLSIIGCVSLSDPTIRLNRPSWNEHKQQLSELKTWGVTGKIGFNKDNDGGSANFSWLQNRSDFDIGIFGPFGAEKMRIVGNPGAVVMHISNGITQSSTSAEALIKQQMQWDIPISGLVYWVRGLPVPQRNITDLKFTNDNRIASLKQDGWEIYYHEYAQFGELSLPTKITLEYQNIKIKLILKNWN